MNNTTTSVFEAIAEIAALPTKLFKLTAIHSCTPFYTARGKTHRLTTGDMVRIEGDKIANVTDDKEATHLVIECRGSLYIDLFEIDCEVIGGDEMITIKL